MNPSFYLRIAIAAIHLCGNISVSPAADTSLIDANASLPLEKIEARIIQIDEEFQKKVGATCTVITSEASAKRISEALAYKLSSPLRSSYPIDFGSLFTSPKLETDNAAVLKALKDLDVNSASAQDQMIATLSGVRKEMRRRIRETVLGKSTPEEINSLIGTIERLIETIERRKKLSGGQHFAWQEERSRAIEALRGLEALVLAENSQSEEISVEMLVKFRNSVSQTIEENDTKTRIDRIVAPIASAVQAKFSALDAAIEARKPSAEISVAFNGSSEVTERLMTLYRAQNGSAIPRLEAQLSFYRQINAVFVAAEAGDVQEARNHLRAASNSANLPAAISSKYRQMVVKIEEWLGEKSTKVHQQRVAETRTRLMSIKTQADIRNLSADLVKWANQEAQPRHPRDRFPIARENELSEIVRPLTTLSEAWKSGDTKIIFDRNRPTGDIRSVTFDKELGALRSRIEHELLGRALNAPELSTPPLAEMETTAALKSLFDSLAQRGDWSRLLEVLQARHRIVMGGEEGAIAALRSFLTGKNFELAEQWAEAVLAYKAVLRSTAEYSPIKAAAERLKAIAKEHPDAFPKEIPDLQKSSSEPNNPAVPKSPSAPLPVRLPSPPANQ